MAEEGCRHDRARPGARVYVHEGAFLGEAGYRAVPAMRCEQMPRLAAGWGSPEPDDDAFFEGGDPQVVPQPDDIAPTGA
jgi:hypothetical protein